MEIIVVNRPLQKAEEISILKQLSSKDSNAELYSNVTLSPGLTAYSRGHLELTSQEKREINYGTFDKILKFGEIGIGGQSLTDLLMIEKVSFWHYHKFRTYFFIRNLTFEIRLIEKLVTDYERIYYYGESALLNNYPFDFPGLTLHLPGKVKSKANFRTIFNYALFFKLRSLAGLFQILRFKNKKHIVIDHAIKQTILNLRTLKPEAGNYNLEYLFEKLDHDFLILDDVEIPKFHKGSDFKIKNWHFKTKGDRLFGEIILWKGLLSGKVRKDFKNSVGQLKRKYKSIKSILSDPIDLIIADYIELLHPASKLFLFKYFAYKKFFGRHHFQSISTIDENSPRIKSILDAAKTCGIKTVGIQHGTIHDLHPAYMFTEQDSKRNLVADYTLVWGESWRKLLSNKGHYDPKTLVITGQIRTDIIPLLTNQNVNDLIKVPDNSKIILFASQPQQDPELREKSALDVFSAVKDIPDLHLIVKLHPAEFGDFNYYKALAERAGCRNFQLVLQVDLYLLISVADAVVTCFSTVGAETVYFSKPLIILDHLKQDIQGYFREGIAFQATSQSELKDCILQLLCGQLTINEASYQKYIGNYAYKIDGQAAERILKFIKDKSEI